MGNWLSFNTLSVGSLTTTLLLALITGYLLSLKNKRPDTWYLAGYLGTLLVLLLSYTYPLCSLPTGTEPIIIPENPASYLSFL